MPSNGRRPPHYELPSTVETSPPHHQQQQERSIEAIQRQLLLALLSTTTTTTTPSSTTTTATMVPTSKMTEAEEEPVQKSTTFMQAAVLYADSRLPSSQKLETLLREVYGLPLVIFYVDRIDEPQTVERNLEQLTAHRGLPYLFFCGTFIGSTEHIQNYHEQRQVPKLVEFVCNGGADKNRASSQASRQQMVEPMAGMPVVGSNKTRLMGRGGADKGGGAKGGSSKNGQQRGTRGRDEGWGKGGGQMHLGDKCKFTHSLPPSQLMRQTGESWGRGESIHVAQSGPPPLFSKRPKQPWASQL